MKSLGTISIALGAERSRNELLPYITGNNFFVLILYVDLMDDEEEILLTLADVLGQFLDFVGGPNHAIHVIKPLEKLCQVEE